MQPDTLSTPWGVVRTLVTMVGVAAAAVIGFGLLPWPGGVIPWTAVMVWVAATLITTHCENVARRRDQPEGRDDDGRV